VVQDLFLTKTAEAADVVFPAQAFTEREGSLTTGERRVQRFYPATPPLPQARPDWKILAEVGAALGVTLRGDSAAEVMLEIAAAIPDYAGISYQALARVEAQWPIVGGDDLYYGGTAYRNDQGLGVKLASGAERGEALEIGALDGPAAAPSSPLILLPVARLYEPGTTIASSKVLAGRLEKPSVALSRADAARLNVREGETIEVRWEGRASRATARVRDAVPEGLALMARADAGGLRGVAAAEIRRME
jgi:NADH-quinone oxidoreductase subunit G